MYKLTTRSKKAEKQFYSFVDSIEISEKLEKLRRYDIRMVYEIDDENKEIVVVAVGSHKIYL